MPRGPGEVVFTMVEEPFDRNTDRHEAPLLQPRTVPKYPRHKMTVASSKTKNLRLATPHLTGHRRGPRAKAFGLRHRQHRIGAVGCPRDAR